MCNISRISSERLKDHLAVALDLCANGFVRLPKELLDDVSSFLSLNDLLILLRVRRTIYERLQEPCKESIYRTLQIDIKCSAMRSSVSGTTYQIMGPLPNVDLLCRSLLRSPSLGTHIRQFSVRFDVSAQALSFYRRFLPLSSTDIVHAERLLSRLDLPNKHEWSRRLRQCRLDLLIGILLTNMSQIEALVLPPELLKSDSFVTHVLNTCASKFQHLAAVDLRHSLPQYPLYLHDESSIHDFLPFFLAPALQQLRLTLPHAPVDYLHPDATPLLKWPNSAPVAFQALTLLELRQSRLPETCLSQILVNCTNLRDLVYQYNCRREHRSCLDASVLGTALSYTAQTLRSLRIDVTWNPCNETHETMWLGGSCVEGSLGSTLSRFQSLTTLAIAPALLSGWNAQEALPLKKTLPANLVKLCLRDDLAWIRDFEWGPAEITEKLVEWIDDQNTELSLRSVCAHWSSGTIAPEVSDAVSKCKKLCQERDVVAHLF